MGYPTTQAVVINAICQSKLRDSSDGARKLFFDSRYGAAHLLCVLEDVVSQSDMDTIVVVTSGSPNKFCCSIRSVL